MNGLGLAIDRDQIRERAAGVDAHHPGALANSAASRRAPVVGDCAIVHFLFSRTKLKPGVDRRPPRAEMALEPRQRGIDQHGHGERKQRAEIDRAGVEQRAVERDQESEPGRGAQHLGDQNADEDHRGADAQPRDDGGHGERQHHLHDQLQPRRAERGRHLRISAVGRAHPDHRVQRDREYAGQHAERDLRFRTDADPHQQQRIDDDEGHRDQRRENGRGDGAEHAHRAEPGAGDDAEAP